MLASPLFPQFMRENSSPVTSQEEVLRVVHRPVPGSLWSTQEGPWQARVGSGVQDAVICKKSASDPGSGLKEERTEALPGRNSSPKSGLSEGSMGPTHCQSTVSGGEY